MSEKRVEKRTMEYWVIVVIVNPDSPYRIWEETVMFREPTKEDIEYLVQRALQRYVEARHGVGSAPYRIEVKVVKHVVKVDIEEEVIVERG